MHGREENLEQNFEYIKEMGHLESLSEFGRIILKWNLTIGLWKNKTSYCYSTGYTFYPYFKSCFLAFFFSTFSSLDWVKDILLLFKIFHFTYSYTE